MDLIYFISGMLLGILIGVFATYIVVKNRLINKQDTIGVLDIDKDDPGLLRFQIDNAENIHEEKYVVFKVNPNGRVSQE